jgi:hypothetical protein
VGVELEELSFRDHSRVWATVRILLRQCQELKAGAGLSDFWNILYLSMNYTDVLSSKGPGKGAQPRYMGQSTREPFIGKGIPARCCGLWEGKGKNQG